ncbi:hypothetical protein SYJ56_23425 [Algoriphagus sp. D3-2-R+10]|uniref:hypothetical protein n=1 Tax=Algoriphagus aurantiacus TaxID=3103948 RepID=UPI002B38A528|nr:hypothetical protein [Algoriphagus sp. D3-2-R+10]MEB2778282.1 hypothetical protein [Algoriphagus sp. D3-2-R+10]
MKKLIVAIFLLGGMTHLSSTEAIAQEVSITEVNTKVQEKVEKAEAKLEKYREDHKKALEKRRDLREGFEKDNSAGKLSPNDIEKVTKKIDKHSKSIEKLEKKMGKLEEFINENS